MDSAPTRLLRPTHPSQRPCDPVDGGMAVSTLWHDRTTIHPIDSIHTFGSECPDRNGSWPPPAGSLGQFLPQRSLLRNEFVNQYYPCQTLTTGIEPCEGDRR